MNDCFEDNAPSQSKKLIRRRPFVRTVLWRGIYISLLTGVALIVLRGAATDDLASTDMRRAIQNLLRARDNFGAHKAYRALFKAAGPTGVSSLTRHHIDAIAIQAAWEEVSLTVPEKPSDGPVRPDRHKLDWFLGFLEGRARVHAPEWWSQVLLDSRANCRDEIYPGELKEQPYHKAGLDNCVAPRNTTLKRQGQKVVLRVGKDSVPIPEEVLRKNDHGLVTGYLSALIMPSRCYVAVHDEVGYSYKLVCIERQTTKVLWQSEVWAMWWGGASGGSHYMWVTVTEQDNRVVVFGAGSLGVHVEVFRADNGSNLLRFSNSY